VIFLPQILLRLTPKVDANSRFVLLNQQIDRLKKEILLRQQVEENLLAVDRRKDRFLAMLGHEIRNPLNTMNNALYVLKRAGGDPQRMQRAGEIIERQVQQMNRIICDLLDVSRIALGRMLLVHDRIDLTLLIRQIVEDQLGHYEEAGLRLKHQDPGRPVWVRGDPARLNQALCNLLHNSRKFTDFGGEVRISLEEKASEGAASITVTDTGTGIDPARIPRLFETFAHEESEQDRKHGGLGLGLPLVKGLVEQHGGAVCVWSEGEGKGTEITIRLPLLSIQEDSHP